MASRDHDQSTTSGKGTLTLAALSAALERYDATPRSKPVLDAAYAELRKAATACGMPIWPQRVVSWSREYLERHRGSAAGVAPVIDEDGPGRNPK